MNVFGADWLKRRAPFDAQARDAGLVRGFSGALPGDASAARRIVDLAAGSGANFRALAPLIGGEQDWLLVDSDPLLLAAQAGEIGRWSRDAGWRCRSLDSGILVEAAGARWHARARRLDLARSVEEVDFAGCDGVTTSAFLDLVSAAWLERLCALLARHARPLLATLTVDGRRDWHPLLPADARLGAAFLRHQERDKGFGPALGPRAAGQLADGLAGRGYEVSVARSDWRIGAEHGDMLRHMVAETVAAAVEADPSGSAHFAEWSRERNAQLSSGTLALEVGHLDLLALPRGRGSAGG